MAGSYNHCRDDETGMFTGVSLLDHLGDAYEALEEMYGMIWLLANGDAEQVEQARQNYKAGIEMSPGIRCRYETNYGHCTLKLGHTEVDHVMLSYEE